MTLILFSGWEKDFVFVSADTREVFQYFDRKTLIPKDKKDLLEDTVDKTELLTNNVLISIGGLMGIGREWKKYMFEHSEGDHFLDDLEPIMKESYKYLKTKEKDDKFYKKYLDSNQVGCFLTGFFKNGDTGALAFHNGEVQKKRITEGSYYANMFAPTQDILDRKKEILDLNEIPLINNNMLESVIHYYATVQAIISFQQPDIVSNRFLGFCLKREKNGGITYQELDLDLTEVQKSFK